MLVLSRARNSRLYECMEPTAATGFLGAHIESRASEIADFDQVVRTYWPRVFRFVLASVRDVGTAETLTQECFYNAYRGRTRFRGDASVHTWLVRIATNVLRDHQRSRRRGEPRRGPRGILLVLPECDLERALERHDNDQRVESVPAKEWPMALHEVNVLLPFARRLIPE